MSIQKLNQVAKDMGISGAATPIFCMEALVEGRDLEIYSLLTDFVLGAS